MELASKACNDCDTLRVAVAEKEWEIAALRSQIEKLTRHDFLTGALNHKGIVETLESELQRAHRTGHPFCFAIIALDSFIGADGSCGKPIGDIVVKSVSETSIRLLRVLDRFGRLDHERFGIVLPATWPDQGLIAMQRLSTAIAQCGLQTAAPITGITFSGGVTTNAVGDTADRLIERAEKALQQAQQEGGHRSVLLEVALPDMPIIDP
jgi:diguanylate cyclase (GGDEF)-like protein